MRRPKPAPSSMGASVRLARETAGLTRQHVAFACEQAGHALHISALYRFETGRASISIERLEAVCRVLGLSLRPGRREARRAKDRS